MDTDKIEKTITYILAPLGLAAILVNLFYIKGYTHADGLDALKDISGLAVAFAVFIVAHKLFKNLKKKDFDTIFEERLKDFISQNKYLLSENFDLEDNTSRRYCYMMIDHSNIITQKKLAAAASPTSEKFAFVKFPYKDEKKQYEYEFCFNPRMFERQNTFVVNDKPDIKAICESFSSLIIRNDNFANMNLVVKAKSNSIIVSVEKLEKTEENAEKLVKLVDYVKILTLALA